MTDSSKHKILVVEDEAEIRELISLILLRAGYALRAVDSAEAAREALAADQSYGLVVLDWMLPNESGIELLEFLQKSKADFMPAVLLVTAKVEPEDIVLGLDKGADDYLTKPFDTRVLVARVSALLRRRKSIPEKNRIEFGDIICDLNKAEVRLAGQAVELTQMEFKLLWVLISNPDVVLTRDKILSLIQNADVNVIGRTVDTHLFSLRKKLQPWSEAIVTVRGVGYRFASDLLNRSASEA